VEEDEEERRRKTRRRRLDQKSYCDNSECGGTREGGGEYVSNKKKVRMTDERDQYRDRDQESGKELV